MQKGITALVFGLSLASCAVTLTEGGKKAQLMKNDPPAGCQELGPVSGRGNGVAGPALVQKAKTVMRNNAAEMGANYVRLETADESSVTGTAYKCPDGAVPEGAAAP